MALIATLSFFPQGHRNYCLFQKILLEAESRITFLPLSYLLSCHNKIAQAW